MIVVNLGESHEGMITTEELQYHIIIRHEPLHADLHVR